MSSQLDQVHAVVEMARNIALALQKEVDAGRVTKQQAIAEFSRPANGLTYAAGAG